MLTHDFRAPAGALRQSERMKAPGEDQDELARLRAENEVLRKDVEALARSLQEAEGSLGWLLTQKARQLIDFVAPKGSRRRSVVIRGLSSLRPWVQDGFRTTARATVVEARESVHLARLRRHAGPRAEGAPGSVLFVSGSFGAMERYRCATPREQLALAGVRSVLRRGAGAGIVGEAERHDLLVLHRIPFSPRVARIVEAAKRHGAPVLFDVDDLVFDPGLMERIDALQWMEPAEAALFRDSLERYRRTLALCDGAIVPTEPLADAVRALGMPAWVHRNAPSLDLLELSEAARQKRKSDPSRVVLGYASGSRTHNRDFLEASPALLTLFAENPAVELHLIGYLDLGPEWGPFLPRVKKLEYVPWRRLPTVLATFDVNLAPLEHGNPFCEAKSELKWVEAAAVEVPTIASPTAPYRSAIRHGSDGYLASTSEEWLVALRALAGDAGHRAAVGAAARASLLDRYHPSRMGSALAAILSGVGDRGPRTGAASDRTLESGT